MKRIRQAGFACAIPIFALLVPQTAFATVNPSAAATIAAAKDPLLKLGTVNTARGVTPP